jgi:hypothetical protein
MKSAPSGWEDENSFHTGQKETVKISNEELS